MITRSQLLGIVFFLMVGLSFLTTNHIGFILLSILALYLGISQFLIDKKAQDSSLNHVRKDFPNWRIIINFGVMLTLYLVLPYVGFDGLFDKLFDNLIGLYAIFVFIGIVFASIHQNFYASLRSYPEGYKMPGKKSELVPWSEVEEMKIVGDSVEIKFQNDLLKFDVDRRDLKFLPKIVETWKNSTI